MSLPGLPRSVDSPESPARARLGRAAWAAWALAEVLLVQSAYASRLEHEPRAAVLFSLLAGVLLLGAGIVRFIHRARLLE
jgi:MFS superfamily sulfate permease-like transporter